MSKFLTPQLYLLPIFLTVTCELHGRICHTVAMAFVLFSASLARKSDAHISRPSGLRHPDHTIYARVPPRRRGSRVPIP